MGAFTAYSLPIQGLKEGLHHFKYTLDGAFFKLFEDSPIGESDIEVELDLDMRSNMMVLDFWLEGWTKAVCDRCNTDIQLPLENEQTIFVKYTADKEDEDDDVVFISREASELNVAKYLYEFAVLSLPITNTYDCENDEEPPCDFEVLDFIKENEDEDNDGPTDSSIWDALKDLKD